MILWFVSSLAASAASCSTRSHRRSRRLTDQYLTMIMFCVSAFSCAMSSSRPNSRVLKSELARFSLVEFPSCRILSITIKLSFSDSSWASKYVTCCLGKHHFSRSWTGILLNSSSESVPCSFSNMCSISTKAIWPWPAISHTFSVASSVGSRPAISSVCPTCLRVSANREIPLAMLWVSIRD